MGWYRNFSRKMFMALASAGRFQTVCDCEIHSEWKPGSYLADSLVTYVNPNTNEISLYRARGDINQDHYTDTENDVPGKSIHWELICVCDEIGFTPTPTPIDDIQTTPTPSPTYKLPTPTPTPRYRCEDYPLWDVNKQVSPGFPHYSYKERVQWKGNVYEARDIEGTELDDVPGISNHWIYLFTCAECLCAPESFEHIILGDYITEFDDGHLKGFISNIKFSYDHSQLEYDRNGVTLKLKLKNSNISGDVILTNKKISYSGADLYMEYNGLCYYAHIKPTNINKEIILDIISFPEICPTPTPQPVIICGEGFPNVYITDAAAGSHAPKKSLSAELFDDQGKLYYNDIEISSLNDAMVYTSAIWKNEVVGKPFGIIVVTGKFMNNQNTIIYEAPDGTCWKGKVQPFGQNIVMYRIY